MHGDGGDPDVVLGKWTTLGAKSFPDDAVVIRRHHRLKVLDPVEVDLDLSGLSGSVAELTARPRPSGAPGPPHRRYPLIGSDLFAGSFHLSGHHVEVLL